MLDLLSLRLFEGISIPLNFWHDALRLLLVNYANQLFQRKSPVSSFFWACSPLPQQAIYFTEMSTCSLWGSTGVGTRVLSQRSSSSEQNQGKSQYPYFQKNCSLGDSVNQTRYLIGTPLTLNRLIDDRLYSAILRSLEQHVSRFGLAVRRYRMVSERTSVRYRFGSPFSSKRLWFVDTVLWLCPSLPTETLKRLSSLPILMQESFWWWQCSDRYINLPLPPPPYLLPPLLPFPNKPYGFCGR